MEIKTCASNEMIFKGDIFHRIYTAFIIGFGIIFFKRVLFENIETNIRYEDCHEQQPTAVGQKGEH